MTLKWIVFSALLGLVNTVVATERAAAVTIDFEREVVPLLEKYCYDCHGNGAH